MKKNIFYKKKVLVAGGTGLVGQQLCNKLNEKGALVYVASLDDKKIADFKQNNLTSDKYRFDRTFKLISKCPDLGVKGLSFGWVNEAIKRTDEFKYPNWRKNVNKPILLLSAQKDTLVDSDKNELICELIPQNSIARINGRHE